MTIDPILLHIVIHELAELKFLTRSRPLSALHYRARRNEMYVYAAAIHLGNLRLRIKAKLELLTHTDARIIGDLADAKA